MGNKPIAGRIWSFAWRVVLLSMTFAREPAFAEVENYLGPCAIVASGDGKTLYVANADAEQIALVDLPRGAVVRSIRAPGPPTGLAVSPDGSKLYVTCAAAESRVVVLDTASGRVKRTIAVGHTAVGPAITPDGKRLYVCNRFDNDVSLIDLEAYKEVARVPAVREPVAAAVSPDAGLVFVANHLPADRADVLGVAAVVTVIDTRTRQTSEVRLPNGATGVRGLCLSPDGSYAFVTHILTVLLDDMRLGAANPWGVACTPSVP